MSVSAAFLAISLPGRDVAGQRDEPHVRDARRGAAPTGTPSPVTTCSTPSGITSFASSMKRSSESGVCSARLQDLHVARGERRPELPDRHHQRVVPRADARRRSRSARGGSSTCSPCMYSPALLPSRLRAAPAKKRRLSARERHLVARDHQRLADVPRLDLRELLGVRRRSRRRASAAARRARPASCRATRAAPPSRARPPRRRPRRRMLGTFAIDLARRGVQHVHRRICLSAIVSAPPILRAQDPALARQSLRERDGDDRQRARSGTRRRSPAAAPGRAGSRRRSRSAACSARPR